MNQKKDIHNKVLVGLGLLFGAWFIFDLTLKIIVYGFTDYDFLWYCDFALILLAYGLFRKNNDFIVAFLASALLLQPLWMIDFAWMGLFKIPLNTLSLSSFQPGFSVVLFVNSLRHIFMIPVAVYAWFILHKTSKKSKYIMAAFITFIFSLSYILTDPGDNSNCVFEPCISVLDFGLTQPYFFIFFTALIVFLSVIIDHFLNMIMTNLLKFKKQSIRKLGSIIFSVMLIATGVIAFTAFTTYSLVPKIDTKEFFSCDDCSIQFSYRYVYQPFKNFDNNLIVYQMINLQQQSYKCNIELFEKNIEGDFSFDKKNATIAGNEKLTLESPLPNIQTNTKITLEAACTKE